MVSIGIAGIGFMGWIHWLAYQAIAGQSERVRIASIATRDSRKRLGDWTDIKGNFGPPGEHVDLAGLAVYETVDQMIDDPSIDLIDICLPPNLHADIAVRALEAGKHVFCEKPMALTIDQCDRMLEAADRSGRHLLVGHVLPFFPEYSFVKSAIDAQTYGPLLGGEFKRTISDPNWLVDFYKPDIVGGPLVDLHVHDAHFIRMIFGMPSALSSVGRTRGEVVEYCATLFEFPNRRFSVSSVSGVICQQGRPFTQGFEIHFADATMQFEYAGFADRAEVMPLKVLTADGQVLRPDLVAGDPELAFIPELNEVLDVVSGARSSSSILDGRIARDAIELCHLQTRAVLSGHKIEV